MRKAAILCDNPPCKALEREELAKEQGWLTIGGGRRGRYRLDLCPVCARIALKSVAEAHGAKRKARRGDQ